MKAAAGIALAAAALVGAVLLGVGRDEPGAPPRQMVELRVDDAATTVPTTPATTATVVTVPREVDSDDDGDGEWDDDSGHDRSGSDDRGGSDDSDSG